MKSSSRIVFVVLLLGLFAFGACTDNSANVGSSILSSDDEITVKSDTFGVSSSLFEALGCSEICVICPDVSSNSGLNSAQVIKSIVAEVKPTVVFAIDSLASRSEERLGNTVQVSSTGIIPGTGVGHRGLRIDEEYLGVPVISIGIPTVISTSCLKGKFNTGKTNENDYFVSPKGINRIVKNGARIIGGGINQAFGIYYF